MRTFRVALASMVCLSMALLCAADWNSAANPTDASLAETMCMLDGLAFSNGLKIIGAFSPTKFNYQCSCDNFNVDSFTTVVYPHMMDDASTAEISFNGKPINFRTSNEGISNGGANGVAPKSPFKQSYPLTFAAGENTIVIGVGCNGLGLPTPCYYKYTITCNKPPVDGGFVVGDPQFVGLRGQSYQVHGVAGEVYNIVSDKDVQYNSRFVFLDDGECPVVNGKKQKGCFSHPGSYLGELGLKTRAGDRIHLQTGDAKQGFAAVEINGRALVVGETVQLAENMGSVSLNSTHLAAVQIGNWDFTFENSDKFVNQRVRVLDSRNLRSHGLLGQTWRDVTYANAVKFIQGTVDDYVIRKKDIFGDNFAFNMHN